MKWWQRLIVKVAWPKIKEYLLTYVNSEEYQELIVNKINKKVDIPNVSEEKEERTLNQIYDAGQEVTAEFIENVDIEKLINKVK